MEVNSRILSDFNLCRSGLISLNIRPSLYLSWRNSIHLKAQGWLGIEALFSFGFLSHRTTLANILGIS